MTVDHWVVQMALLTAGKLESPQAATLVDSSAGPKVENLVHQWVVRWGLPRVEHLADQKAVLWVQSLAALLDRQWAASKEQRSAVLRADKRV